NRTRTDQQRAAPAAERWNIRGESGDHGVDPGHGSELQVRNFQLEVGLGLAGDSLGDTLAQLLRRSDQTEEQLGDGEIRDDVGSAAAFYLADIQGAGSGLRIV